MDKRIPGPLDFFGPLIIAWKRNDYQHMPQQQHMEIMETEITVSSSFELKVVIVFENE
jgi:hypothetical protein